MSGRWAAPSMRTLSALILSALILTTLAACGGDAQTSQTPEELARAGLVRQLAAAERQHAGTCRDSAERALARIDRGASWDAVSPAVLAARNACAAAGIN